MRSGRARSLVVLIIAGGLSLAFLPTTVATAEHDVAGPRAARTISALPAGTDADYQLGGATSVPDNVGIVDRDRDDPPAAGLYNVCYVNGFQAQTDERRFWRQHMNLVLQQRGQPVVDRDWNEWLLDIRTPGKRRHLARIVGRWSAGCTADGFDAVEFDNLDSYTRSRHLIHRKDAVAFAHLLARGAHRVGLAAGQKNMSDLDGTTVGFDFAVSEECGRYRECRSYTRSYSDQVVMVEYRRKDFRRTCTRFGATHPVVLRDRDLQPDFTGRKWC